MNNSAIETGLKAYLTAQLSATVQNVLAGEAQISALAFSLALPGDHTQLVSLHCDVATDSQPETLPWVVSGVQNPEHRGDTLYIAQVLLEVSTPSNQDGITEATHQALLDAVTACFPDMQRLARILEEATLADDEDRIAAAMASLSAAHDQLSALSDAVNAEIPFTVTSYYLQGTPKILIEGRWGNQVQLKMCFIQQD